MFWKNRSKGLFNEIPRKLNQIGPIGGNKNERKTSGHAACEGVTGLTKKKTSKTGRRKNHRNPHLQKTWKCRLRKSFLNSRTVAFNAIEAHLKIPSKMYLKISAWPSYSLQYPLRLSLARSCFCCPRSQSIPFASHPALTLVVSLSPSNGANPSHALAPNCHPSSPPSIELLTSLEGDCTVVDRMRERERGRGV